MFLLLMQFSIQLQENDSGIEEVTDDPDTTRVNMLLFNCCFKQTALTMSF